MTTRTPGTAAKSSEIARRIAAPSTAQDAGISRPASPPPVTYSKTRTVVEPFMRVIPVLDIRRGQAVRAVAGDRAHYGPLRSVLHDGTDPVALARAGRDAWGLPDLYLADLDAILGESPANRPLFRALRDLGLTLWVNAGVRGPEDVPAPRRRGGRSGDRRPGDRPGARGPRRDRRGGRGRSGRLQPRPPSRPADDRHPSRPGGPIGAAEIASRAIDLGVLSLIHLDLARVGTRPGDRDRRGSLPMHGVEWIVGGGIAGIEEIRELARAGFDGVPRRLGPPRRADHGRGPEA